MHIYWIEGTDNGIMVTVVREEDSCGAMAVKMEMERWRAGCHQGSVSGIRIPLQPPTAASLVITCMTTPKVKGDGKMRRESGWEKRGKIDRFKRAKWSESLPHPPSFPLLHPCRFSQGSLLRTLASIKIAACLHKTNTGLCCLYLLPHLTLLHNTHVQKQNSVYSLMYSKCFQM